MSGVDVSISRRVSSFSLSAVDGDLNFQTRGGFASARCYLLPLPWGSFLYVRARRGDGPVLLLVQLEKLVPSSTGMDLWL